MPFLLLLLYIFCVCAAIAAPVAAARYVMNGLPAAQTTTAKPAVKAETVKPATKAASANKHASSKGASAMAKEPPRQRTRHPQKRPQAD